jgi:sarcosine oxidase subunit gamma
MTPGRHGQDRTEGVRIAPRQVEIVQVTARKGTTGDLAAHLEALIAGHLPPAGRAVIGTDRSAIWIAPQTWLVVAPWAGEGVLATLFAQAASASAAIVDQSHGKACIRLSGPYARDVLAKVCRLDLHPRVFGAGYAAVTPIAHVNALLVQIDTAPSFDLIVGSTLAESFAGALLEAAEEFGVVVEAAR